MSLNFTSPKTLPLIILSTAALTRLCSILVPCSLPWNHLLQVLSHAIYSSLLSGTMDCFAQSSDHFLVRLLKGRGERAITSFSKVTSQVGFHVIYFSPIRSSHRNIYFRTTLPGGDTEHEEQFRSNRLWQKRHNSSIVRCGKRFQIVQLLTVAQAVCSRSCQQWWKLPDCGGAGGALPAQFCSGV